VDSDDFGLKFEGVEKSKFELLTYGIEHRTPVFTSHPSYGEDFASNLHQKFELVHQLAANHTEKATKEYVKKTR
jgi:hypothetical protein